jgi:hypothetical protein
MSRHTHTHTHTHSHMQSDSLSVPQEQEEFLHKYTGSVTHRCDPCRCRVKYHPLAQVKKGNISLSLSIHNGKTLNLACFASSLHLTTICNAALHQQWFIEQCNFEIKFTGNECPVGALCSGLINLSSPLHREAQPSALFISSTSHKPNQTNLTAAKRQPHGNG